MLKEIGSNFWINSEEIDGMANERVGRFGKLNGSGTFELFSSGRSAIRYVVQDIKRSNDKKPLKALLPQFTCHTVIEPFLKEGVKICTYPVNQSLYLRKEVLKTAISENHPDIVLIHRYFGFDTADNIDAVIHEYRAKGIIFIEDRTQSIFSSFEDLPVDYVVGSFRKWGAIPDGGFAASLNGTMHASNRESKVDRLLLEAKKKAFNLKYEYMERGIGEKEEFLKAYSYAESILDGEDDFYQMSDESQRIFQSMDGEKLSTKRKSNYGYVYEMLSRVKPIRILTPALTEKAVPLYIAVAVDSRTRLQQELKAHNIYAPVIWPKCEMIGKVSDDVQKIYDKILCLPIDQRYGMDDMERMVNVIGDYFG